MKAILLIGSAMLTLSAQAALAQTATPPVAAQATPQTDAQTAVSNGDIVVTATRVSTLASKTPVSLTAISGAGLTSAGITNPTNLGEQVPNLSIDRGNGLQITIRGVTSTDGTEKGDPSAAFMADGIYIARPQAQEVSFFDIARVEVLRGPQGTLFGRNTTAGLVNIITNHPVQRFEASLDGSYGNYDTRNLTGIINVPVNEQIAVRAAFNYDRRDSFINAGPRLTTNLNPFKDNISGRLSAAWESGPAKLLVMGDYSHIGGQTINGVSTNNFYTNYNTAQVTPTYAPVAGVNAQRTQNAPITTPLDRDDATWGMMADFSYDFGPVTLNYLGSYREFTRHENLTLLPASNTVSYYARDDAAFHQNSQEVRLSGSIGPVKVQTGFYYFDEKGYQNYYIFGLLSPTPGATGYAYGFPQRDVRSESVAGFGQATWSITDSLRLTAGVRYSRDHKSRLGSTVICASTACNQAGDSVSPNNADRVFSKVTWRAGLDYDVNSRTLAYAVVSTGYKAGGFNDGCQVGTGPGCSQTAAALYYQPETITAYEAGVKTRFLDNMVRLNLSVFHYDYNGIQLSQLTQLCGGPCQVTTNAGQAKVDGVEAEGILQLAKNTRIDFSGSWLNARYTQFYPQPGVNWAGFKLDRSAPLSANLGLTQTFPLPGGANLQGNVHTRITDAYYMAALSTLNQFRQPGFTKTDISLTYNPPSGKWYVQGFARNLENATIITGASSGAYGSVTLADPRTYGVRAGMHF